jgi:DNA repair exonuclease SbcCD ATPase subunit
MIRRLTLAGWRAFDSLVFEPGPGVTFVIARNGTGKTSLLDGISWGTFGDRSGIDAAAMVRAGHTRSRVTVDLDGPDGLPLRIERTVGGPVQATLGTRSLDEEMLDSALRQVFGANLDFAARATMLGHTTLLDQARSFEHLEAHLADVFGISHLRDAAEAIEGRYNLLKSANQRLRKEARARPDVNALRGRAQVINAELTELREQRPVVQAAFDAASQAQRALVSAQEAAGEYKRWHEAHAGLATNAEPFAGAGPGDLDDRLRFAVEAREHEVSELTRTIGAADATITGAKASLDSLDEPGAVCPTCQRPLADHERAAARRTHAEAVAKATADAADAREQRDVAARALTTLRQLLREVERLGPPPPPPTTGSANDEVVDAFERARTEWGELERQIGERQGALAEIERTLQAAAAAAQADAERYNAIRREAVAQLAASITRLTVDELMEQRVGPIADEVSARWKQVFGDRGTLRMSPKGEITMERVGHRIAFKSFSPGEQVVSMLALRFLTVAASTTSPFMLLDEPLECLDPPNRRLIASVLVGADRPVSQMIVTTYEEALVRRIHATVPETDVRMIS